MRSLNKVTKVLTLYEIKACYDIVLINMHTRLDSNYDLIPSTNIYRFIYGRESKPAEGADYRFVGDLDYRYRYNEELANTKNAMPGADPIDIIAQDIINTYKRFCVHYMKTHSSPPVYGNITITEDVILNAVDTLKKAVIKLIMKLFHNETVYTLLLSTPIGKEGLYKRLDRKLYGVHKTDIFDMDYASFRDYLIYKRSRIINTAKYVDIQGLTFNCLDQYFSEVHKNPDIQQRYALYSVKDIETSKGVMDKSSRDLLEMKSAEIPTYSLTGLFNKCRELDSVLFTKRNTNTFNYSIIEWYADYVSTESKKFLVKNNISKSMPQFMGYQECFENTMLLGNSAIDVSEDFRAKIESAKKIFTELFEKWYMQKNGTVDRAKINSLCKLCEYEYTHLSIDYNTGQHYGSKRKKTHGVLDVSNASDATGDNHYINLEYYNKVPSNYREMYTSVKSEEVNIYLEPYFQANAKEGPCSFMSIDTSSDSIDMEYVLLPSGLKRIQQILEIFQELDELSAKLEKINATIQELLPAYYNNMPCTLEGALVYALQEKRIAVQEPSKNPLFDGALLNSLSETVEEATTFDWSLPKWYKETDNRSTGVDMDLSRVTSNLCGLGQEHYPKYLESILFTILTQAFPRSIQDNNSCYYFIDESIASASSCDIGEYNGTDYTMLMKKLGCVEPTAPTRNDFIMQETDQELADSFADDNWTETLAKLDIDIMELVDTLDDIELAEYRIDLRKEFFTQNNVNTLYTLVTLAMLLCNEFYTYKTKAYRCDYVGLNQATKKTWTTRAGGTFITTFKETHEKDFKDLGPRVEDVISKIAGAIQTIFNEDEALIPLRDQSSLTLVKDSKAMEIIDIISGQLIENPALRVPALAELTPDMIKKRLLENKYRLKPFTYNNRNYVLVVASIDMIIFNGIKYSVKVKDGYMYAIPFRKEDEYPTFKISLNGVTLTPLHYDDGWKKFFTMTQNNAAIRYIYMSWEPKIRELIAEMCKSTFNGAVTPIVFTTKNVWQLMRYMFCDIASQNGQERPIMVVEANVAKNISYEDPDCPPSKLITEVPRKVTNLDGSEDEVYEYYWTVSNEKYPYVLDYLAVWNNAKMLLEAFSDIHQVSYTLHNVALDPKYRYNSEYRDYLSQGFTALLWEQPNKVKTPIDLLNWSALSVTEDDIMIGDTSQGNSSPFKPVRWNVNAIDKTRQEQRRHLIQMQSKGVIHYLKSNNITYHTGTGYVSPLTEVLDIFKSKLDSIQSKSLFAVKGVDDSTKNAEEKLKIYGLYKDAIKQFVDDNRQSLNAIRIGTEKTGRSLQSERFYRVNNWVRDQETGILCTLSKIPYMVKKGNLVGFLYHIGYWICIDINNPSNITFRPYEELK